MDPGTDRLTPAAETPPAARFRLSLLELFLVTALFAILLAFWQASPQLGYFWSVTPLPAAIGIHMRCRGAALATCLWSVFLIAVVETAAIAAAGSAWATFHQNAVGVLVGDGLNSVAAAGILGAFVGGLLSVFPLSIVLLAEPGISELRAQKNAKRSSDLRDTPDNAPDLDRAPPNSIPARRQQRAEGD